MFQITDIKKFSDEFVFLFNPNFILDRGLLHCVFAGCTPVWRVALRWAPSNCLQYRCCTQHCTISAPWGLIRLQNVRSPMAAIGLQMAAATTLHTPGGALPWCPSTDFYHRTTETVGTEPIAYSCRSGSRASSTTFPARVAGKVFWTWRILKVYGRKRERFWIQVPWILTENIAIMCISLSINTWTSETEEWKSIFIVFQILHHF
jgi:hypothetical protein